MAANNQRTSQERERSDPGVRVMQWMRGSVSYLCLLVIALAGAQPSYAESSDFVDSAAHVLAVFIIIVVPIGGIALFWMVHILPEKFAEKRHHPQLAAIKTLCLLSLVFGGLLWPIAWLWAFTKPVLHQMAYGRDKPDDYYEKHGLPTPAGDEAKALRAELGRVKQEIVELEKRGDLPTALQALRERRAELEAATPPTTTTTVGAG